MSLFSRGNASNSTGATGPTASPAGSGNGTAAHGTADRAGTTDPAPGGSTPDARIDALESAYFDSLRRRVEKGKREDAEREAKLAGACRFCGVNRCPHWTSDARGQVCVDCFEDRGHHDDETYKNIILNRIISGDWSRRRYAMGRNRDAANARAGILFFAETPGAVATRARWGYLIPQMDAIRARATAEPEPLPPIPTVLPASEIKERQLMAFCEWVGVKPTDDARRLFRPHIDTRRLTDPRYLDELRKLAIQHFPHPSQWRDPGLYAEWFARHPTQLASVKVVEDYAPTPLVGFDLTDGVWNIDMTEHYRRVG